MGTNAARGEPDKTHLPIGKVVELVRRSWPSVTPSSLRFLEREGLLVPMRTPGGHRLYSEADIQRIVQIKEWQAQRYSLDEIRDRLSQLDAVQNLESLARRFLAQVLAGEVEAAGQSILEIDALGMPLHRIFGEVIEPALIEVGRGWQHGTILVAQEKTVSELVRDLIAELSLRHAAPDPRGPCVVAACVKGERHELGLRMIVGMLRAEGFRVQYLGADVDAGFLLDAVRLHAPAAVLLSARLNAHEPGLMEAIAALRAAIPHDGMPHIVVGGQLAVARASHLASLGVLPIVSATVTGAMETLRSIIAVTPDAPDAG